MSVRKFFKPIADGVEDLGHKITSDIRKLRRFIEKRERLTSIPVPKPDEPPPKAKTKKE